MSKYIKDTAKHNHLFGYLPADNKCVRIGCNNDLGDLKSFCKEHKKERSEHFREQYYRFKGWSMIKFFGKDIKLSFGKHKFKSLETVFNEDFMYLSWLLGQEFVKEKHPDVFKALDAMQHTDEWNGNVQDYYDSLGFNEFDVTQG